MTGLLREFAAFNGYVRQFAECGVFDAATVAASEAFRGEFVEVNCDLQSAFVENDDLLDRLAGTREALRATEALILEKANLISLYDARRPN